MRELLVSPKWTKVTTIGRSPLNLTEHANANKLNEVTVCTEEARGDEERKERRR